MVRQAVLSTHAPPSPSNASGALTSAIYGFEHVERFGDTERRRSLARRAAHMLVLGVAYYVGAMVGFRFQSPVVPQSVLWTPNSILFAALLVSPRRQWPELIAAALPAQLLVGWQQNAPLLTMSLIFLTNAADAVLGAVLLQYVSRGAWRPNGLRPLILFLVVGAPVATFLLSFADAGITWTRHWGSGDFWLALRTRVRANVLTNVILVPAAVALVDVARAPRREISNARWAEGVLVLVGLSVSTRILFAHSPDSGVLAAMLYAPLPFLLWAAVRFGPGMAAGSLLLLAYVTTWSAMRGLGVFSLEAPGRVVPALQLFLIAIAVPILLLSGVVQERQRGSDELRASQRALEESVEQSQALSGRLLTAVETERSRIARELHDDVSQRLAAFSIVLSRMRQNLPDETPPPVRGDILWLQQQTATLVDGVRHLSHELHPSVLRHAGLIPAIRSLCSQLDSASEIRAEVKTKGDGVRVTFDVALCVYRVAQEALQNVARHSGARVVQVSLMATDAEITLEISDDGRGFDQHGARRNGGLGLTSMDERVRLARGSLQLETMPGGGTRVFVRVPNGERQNGASNRPPRG
jgi:signal transduction histidine kinase